LPVLACAVVLRPLEKRNLLKMIYIKIVIYDLGIVIVYFSLIEIA